MNPAFSLSEKLLNVAIKLHASDIHFYPFEEQTKIYFRIHGKRIFQQTILGEQYDSLLTYYKFTSGMDIGEVRKPQNGVITFNTRSIQHSLRLSTLPVNEKESLAIRILPQEEVLPLEQLFLFPSQIKKLTAWTANQTGILLLTGPTGSGKTTTLYALLQAMMKETTYQTITLEDPIEKNLHDILQVQINEKAGITYQTGIKAVLRHDPDIIMVGEIRDPYTAQFAFDASLTGHLVLSTLHAKNTIGTIHRLLEMGVKKDDIKQSLIGVASLQLLPLIKNKQIYRRAAIAEMVDGSLLEKIIDGKVVKLHQNTGSFHYLRKKAFAYGYYNEHDF